MVYSAQAVIQCRNCGHVEDSPARFCPACGANAWQSVLAATPAYAPAGVSVGSPGDLQYQQLPYQGTPTLILPEHMPKSVPTPMARALTQMSDTHVPNFAHVRRISAEAAHQKQVELAKMMVILARERLFLLFHFSFWVCLNLIGFALALKCYNEFIGDEMTRIMIGCSPFWIFNILGLTCFIPIRGTRRSIGRLKEQIAHLKFTIDYGHLI